MKRELEQLVAAARDRRMTPDELEQQRISFAFGNAPEGDHGTIESMKAASTIMRTSRQSN